MIRDEDSRLSIYISYLLRHAPQDAGLDMDLHGWVLVDQLVRQINAAGKYHIDLDTLKAIVDTDDKKRFRVSENGQKIKACQGHSISWVKPELEIIPPPRYLYHGTNTEALGRIMATGAILKMSRHAVHMQADVEKAWRSAVRWKGKKPVVLKIDAVALAETGVEIGKSENDVWCCERVPTKYITDYIYLPNEKSKQIELQ